MTKTIEEVYILTVQTNSYAGNFEREFTAYTTGQIGDCGVGDEHVSLFNEEKSEDITGWFEEFIHQEPDDNHTERPCAMAVNRAGDWDDIEIYFSEQPTPEAMEVIKRRALQYVRDVNGITIFGYEMWKRTRTTVREEITEWLEIEV